MSVTKERFGVTEQGLAVDKYRIRGGGETYMEVTDFGATLLSVCVPDRTGKLTDVVLGFDDLAAYETRSPFFGAIVGRNANRIRDAHFTLNGNFYQLEANSRGRDNLHSGSDGYLKRVWEVKEAEGDHVVFSLLSPDMDQGFPGNFKVEVTYTLTARNEVVIDYRGRADQDTIVNMTSHTYFNLGGHDAGSVRGHVLWMDADVYLPAADERQIPTGELRPVAGTPFDFTGEETIGSRIDEADEQLLIAGGYDHHFVLNRWDRTLRLAAKVRCPETGIVMEMETDQPGLQLYTANGMYVPDGKGGAAYGKQGSFCLETQYPPNAVNQAAFPNPVLRAGEEYQTTTIFRFLCEK